MTHEEKEKIYWYCGGHYRQRVFVAYENLYFEFLELKYRGCERKKEDSLLVCTIDDVGGGRSNIPSSKVEMIAVKNVELEDEYKTQYRELEHMVSEFGMLIPKSIQFAKQHAKRYDIKHDIEGALVSDFEQLKTQAEQKAKERIYANNSITPMSAGYHKSHHHLNLSNDSSTITKYRAIAMLFLAYSTGIVSKKEMMEKHIPLRQQINDHSEIYPWEEEEWEEKKKRKEKNNV